MLIFRIREAWLSNVMSSEYVSDISACRRNSSSNVCFIFCKSTYRLCKMRTALPSPSRISPKSKCSGWMLLFLNRFASSLLNWITSETRCVNWLFILFVFLLFGCLFILPFALRLLTSAKMSVKSWQKCIRLHRRTQPVASGYAYGFISHRSRMRFCMRLYTIWGANIHYIINIAYTFWLYLTNSVPQRNLPASESRF